MTDPFDAVQPESDLPTTWVHTFLVARPGHWEPMQLRSGAGEPTSREEEMEMIQGIADDLKTPAQFVLYLGAHEWTDTPFEDAPQAAANPRPLVVPKPSLIIPGRSA